MAPAVTLTGDWQDLAQSALIGLIFAFLAGKLISTLFSFRHSNLRVAREADLPPLEQLMPLLEDDGDGGGGGSSTEEDEDWGDEDEDGGELDEVFSAATAFVAAAAADRSSGKVSDEVKLRLYGLYKVATEGACSTPPPSALKMTARAKWNAWQKLGDMPLEEAMLKYIEIVTEFYPTWASGSTSNERSGKRKASTTTKGTMGPVFSSFVCEEESQSDLKMDEVHGFAREGDMKSIMKYVEDGISLNVRDSEGRTPLHWAVDRGHTDIVNLLINKNADINAQDNEGQTPLHYATVCDREAIAELLVEHKADTNIKDNDGCIAKDLCESNWPWL